MVTTQVFGEVQWSDDVYGGQDKKFPNSKDLFLRLDEGSNEVRLITQPYQYLVHKFKKEGDTVGFGQKISCSALNGSCPLCDLGDKAKPRWLLGVISRKTGTYKILDISFAVFSQIKKYNKNPRFGDPTKYDINIEVDKNGGATGYYSIQGLQKEPLSAADQVIKDSADLDDLKRRVTPPTAEFVQKRMDKINGVASTETTGIATAVAAGKSSGTAAKTVVPVVSMSDDEDLEKSFPSYDETTTA